MGDEVDRGIQTIFQLPRSEVLWWIHLAVHVLRPTLTRYVRSVFSDGGIRELARKVYTPSLNIVRSQLYSFCAVNSAARRYLQLPVHLQVDCSSRQ